MKNMKRYFFAGATLLLLTMLACGQKAASPPAQPQAAPPASESVQPPQRGMVLKDVPEKIDAQASYLFYLHGRIIEEKGIRPTDERFGVYEYEEILKTLADRNFIVISEARPKGTDPKQYAPKIVGQVKALLKAGVAPQRITVVGASKGAIITMLVSTLLKNRDVNFVVMSNCNDWVLENFEVDLHGNVLSIYDVKDEFGVSCRKIFERASGLNRQNEIMLKVGTGHAILYKPLKEWVDPVVRWANEQK